MKIVEKRYRIISNGNATYYSNYWNVLSVIFYFMLSQRRPDLNKSLNCFSYCSWSLKMNLSISSLTFWKSILGTGFYPLNLNYIFSYCTQFHLNQTFLEKVWNYSSWIFIIKHILIIFKIFHTHCDNKQLAILDNFQGSNLSLIKLLQSTFIKP